MHNDEPAFFELIDVILSLGSDSEPVLGDGRLRWAVLIVMYMFTAKEFHCMCMRS